MMGKLFSADQRQLKVYVMSRKEAMGLCEALSWIHELQLIHVKFEMDAQTVVLAINSPNKDESEFGSIVEDCRVFLQHEPSSFSIHFVSRIANRVSHTLARES